jgi:hypothetical protein
LRDTGFGNNEDARVLAGALFLGLVYFIGSLMSLFKMDSLGRRTLMLRCLPFLVIAMVLISSSMFMRHKFDYWKLSGLTSFVGSVIFLLFFANGF